MPMLIVRLTVSIGSVKLYRLVSVIARPHLYYVNYYMVSMPLLAFDVHYSLTCEESAL